MNFNKIKKEVERELENVLEPLGKQVDKIVKLILSKKSIFLAGQGRSKIVAEAFAMRLVQLGFKTFIVGEATTPAITSKDLLIAISGSGKTPITYEIVKQAKKSKSKICLITADKKSKTAKKSDLIIEIKAPTKLKKGKSIEPLASLFEKATFVYLDSLIVYLMKKTKKTSKSLRKTHTNLE